MQPVAIKIGCPINEFWYESPKLFWQYFRAYSEQKEEEAKAWQSQVNVSAWLQGQYIIKAIGASFSNKCKYPEKPLKVFENSSRKNLSVSSSCEEDDVKKEFQKIALRLVKT